jgi:hypothetical protein
VQVRAVGVEGTVVGLRILPRIVGEFVVVPDGDEGEALVQRLQARIGAVLFVQVAVVGQRVGVLGAGAAVLNTPSGSTSASWRLSTAPAGSLRPRSRRCSRPGGR